ncbi:hypothetical protein AGABI1DRAFT_132023 [Agaricus bisporus var. burnettii JB137-S8]|uniref:Sister chromatid cohesion protein n=1 Tax=Agaricus bisporus var. burnettii (strain JB137-S8 / ATCC MYA-4627 / FGSC 10392) TaxID=597362 RepID=K5WK36_AGABU|nr:uncharacterized protein AGABI1DRAFT_132023 [Agaricus bisporus var. burnettii JB137-S8]EKM75631.1 hypothetical protein AGABI1DRAFT_132023 [Agaricus bisporus var. burnettii JB137-S8]
MVAQTRHHNKVVFRDKLAGKGLTADQIVKKLHALHDQLEKQDQDEIDRNSLATARAELIHKTILFHKDQGVRAYTACCLAELLRLYAPDAPYTQPELRDIFQFFIGQLKDGLKNSETASAYHNQYFSLLESLSTVKSAVLVCDLPSGDELMNEFFTTFFYIVRRGTANKKMESFMGDILIAILDECQSVPQTVLDTILAQFMDKDPRPEQPAYRLAVTVCNAVSDKLQRPVSQYFTDIIVDSAHATTAANASNISSDDENEDDKFEQLQNAHELIKRLHHVCPTTLDGVIPQLVEELRVDHVNVRVLATQALGEMYADKNGPELASKYPTTWEAWLSRKNDKVVAIRLKFVESLRALVANLPTERNTLADALGAKLLDPDEKVRAAVCKMFSQLDYESALHNISESLLRSVADRFLDKKGPVRAEALNSLGKLYSLSYPEIENNDVIAIKKFGWIPNSILEAVSQSPLIRDVADRVWAVHILPLAPGVKAGEVDPVLWTEKLLNVMKHLSDKSIEILVTLSTIKEMRPGLADRYLEACISYNGGVIDQDEEKVTHTLNTCIHTLTTFVYMNDHKASEDLHSFAKLNQDRLYKLLKTCFNPQTDIKTLGKSSTEFLRRLEQSSASLITTMTTLLYRGSFHIFNHSSIPTLLKKITKRRTSNSPSAQLAGANATTILKAITKYAPGMARAHVGELCKCLLENSSTGSDELTEITLRLLANLVKAENDVVVSDKRVIERIKRMALGSERRQTKFAARFLVLNLSAGTEPAREVLERIVNKLKGADDDELAAHIAALVQYARHAPDLFEEQSDIVVEHLVRRVINVPILDETPEGSEETAEEWHEDANEVPSLLWAKVDTLKLFRHRCLNAAVAAIVAARNNESAGNANGKGKGKAKEADPEKEKEKAEKIVGPVVKMLQALMVHEGAMSEGVREDPKARSRMRLQAAVTMLHLARMDIYTSAVMSSFGKLVLTIQDTCYGVRSTFLNKLITLYMTRKLPPPFGVVFFLTVHDPEEDVKGNAATCVRALLKKLNPQQRVEYFELLFVRLLHILAHHPDFSTEHEDLLDLAKYIQFYLDLVATSENVPLLYHLATKGKTVRDHSSFVHSENFYILCELAQDLIKGRASAHSWPLPSYPGKVRMPADILRPLPNAEAANRILQTTFLPEGTREWVAAMSHQQLSKKKERKVTAMSTAIDGETDGGSTVSTGKRKASRSRAKTNGSSKRRKGLKKDKWDSDENDDDDDNDDNKDEDTEENDDDDEGQEEDSDVEMEDSDRRGKRQVRGKAKAKSAGKGKATNFKPKSKSKAAKQEEYREAREAKGLRTSARSRKTAQDSKKQPRLDESEDDDETDKMETS